MECRVRETVCRFLQNIKNKCAPAWSNSVGTYMVRINNKRFRFRSMIAVSPFKTRSKHALTDLDNRVLLVEGALHKVGEHKVKAARLGNIVQAVLQN